MRLLQLGIPQYTFTSIKTFENCWFIFLYFNFSEVIISSLRWALPSNTNSRPKATKKRFDYAFALPSPHLRPEVGIKSPERHEDEQNATKGRPIYECALWSPFDRHMFAFLLPGHPVGEQKTQHFFLFAIQVLGQPFYEWNPKLIHLRHAFVFLFVFCAH